MQTQLIQDAIPFLTRYEFSFHKRNAKLKADKIQ